ncbi:hypothetical protein M885DRAFT_537207 [Pelagophyceae sp. CCMP2097]|nr:hypothetical protein M885DRAFT_537207 [Pelagophyceae sp. CCMP2097]
MVKGNWERRIELAQLRKSAAKEVKKLKAEGLLVEPENLLLKLFAFDADATVYLAADDAEARPNCRAFFRDDACGNRRCKHAHAVSIGGLRRSAATADDNADAPKADAAKGAAATDAALDVVCGTSDLLWPPRHHGRRDDGGARAAAPPRARARAASEDAAAGRGGASFDDVFPGRAMPDSLVLAVVDFCGTAWRSTVSATCERASFESPVVDAAKRAALPSLQLRRNRALVKQAARLRFCASRGWLAHDAEDVVVWKAFEARFLASEARLRSTSVSGSFSEPASASAAPPAAPAPRPALDVAALPEAVTHRLFAFAPDAAAAALAAASRACRAAAKADVEMRRRRREGLAAAAARDKVLKNKRGVAARGKKDGFTRGR